MSFAVNVQFVYHKRDHKYKKHEVDDKSSGMAAGLKYASEFSAAVLVGVFFGYLADKFIGTTPWGLLAGLIFGFGAGVLNVVRSAKEGMDGI